MIKTWHKIKKNPVNRLTGSFFSMVEIRGVEHLTYGFNKGTFRHSVKFREEYGIMTVQILLFFKSPFILDNLPRSPFEGLLWLRR